MRVVTSIAARPRHRSLVGVLLDAAPALRRVFASVMPLVREHAVSVAAFTAIDYGAFELNAYAGWIMTGVTALLLDFLVRG